MATIQVESVRCPWCLARFDIDPTLAAFPYKCPNPDCREISTIGTLRQPNFGTHAVHLSLGLTKAASDNVYGHTLAYVYNNKKIASGTLIQIGNRCLVATTAYSLPGIPSKVECVPKLKPEQIGSLPTVVAVTKSDSADVGIIELESDAPHLLGMDAITIGRIADLQSGRHGCRAWLIGYPEKQLVPHYGMKGILGFQALSASAEPIEPAAWAKVDVGKIDDEPGELSKDMHVLIHYNTTEAVYSGVDDSTAAESAPEPYGMSGGGLWQTPEATADTAIWSASNLCLFAIQSSWPKQGEHLKAIQVIHWLSLVADTYPELSDELTERFPRLARTSSA